MTEGPARPIDSHPLPIGRVSKFIWLGRAAMVGVLILLIGTQVVGEPHVSVAKRGDITIYASNSSFLWYSVLLVAVLGCLMGCFIALVFASIPVRCLGAVLAISMAWHAFFFATDGMGNHYVQVDPSSVIQVTGTESSPIRHEIDFSATVYLEIARAAGGTSPKYELVAYATRDGSETRIPISDLMRAALPQVFEYASKYDLIIAENENGLQIPEELRQDVRD